jgi:dihydroorotase
MPNLKNPILSASQAERYEDEIKRLAEDHDFEPLMTIKLTQETSPQQIHAASARGVRAVKLYPEGVTTNSVNGVRDIDKLDDVLKAMSDYGVTLCIHAEEPGEFTMHREHAYLERVKKIVYRHPSLKIVIEHVTTLAAVEYVKSAGPNVAATITVHHLFLTLDDILGDKLQPHNFCKPVAKAPIDRESLRRVALSGNPKFFLGTDSAPHEEQTKTCVGGCAGCFTSPIAIELLMELFEKENAISNLEAFTSDNGAKFYRMKPNSGTLTLERTEWTIPAAYSCEPGKGMVIVPFKANEKLQWRVV